MRGKKSKIGVSFSFFVVCPSSYFYDSDSESNYLTSSGFFCGQSEEEAAAEYFRATAVSQKRELEPRKVYHFKDTVAE